MKVKELLCFVDITKVLYGKKKYISIYNILVQKKKTMKNIFKLPYILGWSIFIFHAKKLELPYVGTSFF
jgi:hypothetical protein